jgi:ribosomal protein S27E
MTLTKRQMAAIALKKRGLYNYRKNIDTYAATTLAVNDFLGTRLTIGQKLQLLNNPDNLPAVLFPFLPKTKPAKSLTEQIKASKELYSSKWRQPEKKEIEKALVGVSMKLGEIEVPTQKTRDGKEVRMSYEHAVPDILSKLTRATKKSGKREAKEPSVEGGNVVEDFFVSARRPPQSAKLRCPKCKSNKLILDKDEVVCKNCGEVMSSTGTLTISPDSLLTFSPDSEQLRDIESRRYTTRTPDYD